MLRFAPGNLPQNATRAKCIKSASVNDEMKTCLVHNLIASSSRPSSNNAASQDHQEDQVHVASTGIAGLTQPPSRTFKFHATSRLTGSAENANPEQPKPEYRPACRTARLATSSIPFLSEPGIATPSPSPNREVPPPGPTPARHLHERNMNKAIPTEVLDVLKQSRCEGNQLHLPRQLPRNPYVETAKVIELPGERSFL